MDFTAVQYQASSCLFACLRYMVMVMLNTTGDYVVQLYKHFRSQAVPACTFPSTAKLAEVAQLSVERQQWATAMAAAQDLAATNAEAAAQVAADIMHTIQTHSGPISTLAAGMALLHAADRRRDTVKVSLLHCTTLPGTVTCA